MEPVTPFSDSNPPSAIISEYRISRKTTAIYLIVLLMANMVFAFLLYTGSVPKMKVPWLGRSSLKHFVLLAPDSGTVTKVLVKEYQNIGKGDTLLMIKSD